MSLDFRRSFGKPFLSKGVFNRKMRPLVVLFAFLALSSTTFAQTTFESDPAKAQFITEDIPSFWKAYDKFFSNGGNPFRDYLEQGSIGLRDFIPYRIESPKYLKKMVMTKKEDYERIREGSFQVEQNTTAIREFYFNLKEMYDSAVFPPTYFVVGAFNSGGTSTKNGLIIGVEMQLEIENIPYIVAHELVHFNQNYGSDNPTLLEQSIKEGSADFIGELISGKHINETAAKYAKEHEEMLCAEFVKIMDDRQYHGWLYGSKGKKEGRPNDLGYWMGYKICELYYKKAEDKKQAIVDILNISDFKKFVEASGYLAEYIH